MSFGVIPARQVSLPDAASFPLKNIDNRALYVRIVANALIGSAGIDDLKLLQALAQHEYRSGGAGCCRQARAIWR